MKKLILILLITLGCSGATIEPVSVKARTFDGVEMQIRVELGYSFLGTLVKWYHQIFGKVLITGANIPENIKFVVNSYIKGNTSHANLQYLCLDADAWKYAFQIMDDRLEQITGNIRVNKIIIEKGCDALKEEF